MNEEFRKLLIENGVSVQKTLERFMNNEGLYTKFLGKFLEDTNFNGLKESISQGNIEEAFKFAHTIKGVAANLGLDSLNDSMEIMVEKLRKGNCENINELFEAFNDKYNKICDIIRNNL